MEPGVGITPSPPLAQSTAHRSFRRPPGRTTAREGVFFRGGLRRPVWWKEERIQELFGHRNLTTTITRAYSRPESHRPFTGCMRR